MSQPPQSGATYSGAVTHQVTQQAALLGSRHASVVLLHSLVSYLPECHPHPTTIQMSARGYKAEAEICEKIKE